MYTTHVQHRDVQVQQRLQLRSYRKTSAYINSNANRRERERFFFFFFRCKWVDLINRWIYWNKKHLRAIIAFSSSHVSTVHKTVSGLHSGSANLSIFSLYLTFATALFLFLAGFLAHHRQRKADARQSGVPKYLNLCSHLCSSSGVILISISALMHLFMYGCRHTLTICSRCKPPRDWFPSHC